MKDNQSYTVQVLTRFLNGEVLTHIGDAKNSNQYFKIIKDKNIKLVEIAIPNEHNHQSHFERSLNQDEDNITKARELLKKLVK